MALTLALAYSLAYVAMRHKDISQRPFYVIIRYGTDRLVVRCCAANFVEDAPGQASLSITEDPWFDPEGEYSISRLGLFVTMNRHGSLCPQRVFWPLERCELLFTRVKVSR